MRRPLGLLGVWLRLAANYSTAADHINSTKRKTSKERKRYAQIFTHQARSEARECLTSIDELQPRSQDERTWDKAKDHANGEPFGAP